ncbi:unnamed protein product [Calypogeia fissa]
MPLFRQLFRTVCEATPHQVVFEGARIRHAKISADTFLPALQDYSDRGIILAFTNRAPSFDHFKTWIMANMANVGIVIDDASQLGSDFFLQLLQDHSHKQVALKQKLFFMSKYVDSFAWTHDFSPQGLSKRTCPIWVELTNLNSALRLRSTVAVVVEEHLGPILHFSETGTLVGLGVSPGGEGDFHQDAIYLDATLPSTDAFQATWAGFSITVAAIYSPNSPGARAELWRLLAESSFLGPSLLIGDFNNVEFPADSLSASPLLQGDELVAFNSLKITKGLVDCYKEGPPILGPSGTLDFSSLLEAFLLHVWTAYTFRMKDLGCALFIRFNTGVDNLYLIICVRY